VALQSLGHPDEASQIYQKILGVPILKVVAV
jgi:hypothetical protein